jgi:cysteine synthase B
MKYPTIEDAVGNTPLVALQRIGAQDNAERGNVVLGKLEGNNPAGSVKDRPALSMIRRAEERGDIRPGDTLIEATSGNTGIALAMAAAIKGYRMVLVMPEDLSIERAQTMKAFGAELVLTPKSGGMERPRPGRGHAKARRGQGAGPVCQPRQPAHPLRNHRPRAVGADGWAHHPLCQRHGHHGHHHRRVALS